MNVGFRVISTLGLAGMFFAGHAFAGLTQSIPAANISVKLPDAAPFALPSAASSGLPIAWQSITGPATVAGNMVTLTGGTGAVTLRGRQAGDAAYDPAADRYETFTVDLGGGFLKIAAGEAHVAGIRSDGYIWTWGRNGSGQLGNGTTEDRAIPARLTIPGTSLWTDVVCGSSHTLALRADGTLWSWGSNSDGQLGISNTTDKSFPIQIGTDSTWTGIACGSHHCVARKLDGSLWAWGDNSAGQLGDGTIADRTSPVRIGQAQDWVEVACGGTHTLARRGGGSLWAWGYNAYGQLGDGTTTRRLAPVRVGTDSDWKQISAGFLFSAARRTNGTLWAWGNNDSGQLGDNTRAGQISPKQVGVETNWTAVNCGASFVIAQKSDGNMWAWGDNSAGELGDLTNLDALLPVPTLPGPWTSVASGAACVLAVKNGSLWTWGTNDNQQLALPPSLIGVIDVPPAVRLPYPTPQTSQPLPAVAGLLHSLMGFGSSGLPATLRVISGPAVASEDGHSISFNGTGAVEIEVSHPGDLAWEAAPPQTFTVQIDGTGPVFTNPAATRTVQLDSPGGTVVNFTVEAVDAITGPAVVTCVPPGGSVFPGGITTVICTASDDFGNENTTQFDVIVNRPPSFFMASAATIGRMPVHISKSALLAAISDPDISSDLPVDQRGFTIPASTAFQAGHGVTVWDGEDFSFVAAQGFYGNSTVTFSLTDGQGATVQASFVIVVAQVPTSSSSGGEITLSAEGKPLVAFASVAGAHVEIERSTDLLIWTSITSQTVPEDGTVYCLDADKFPNAFYRLRTEIAGE